MPSAWCQVSKGRGHRAARERLHHRCLHLEEAALGEEASHEVHHPGSGAEGLACLLVHDEVEVAPAVARLPVGEPVELLGQRAERLREQPEAVHPQRQLAGPGTKRNPFRPHEIPDVPAAEVRIRAVREVVAPQVELKAPGAVLEVGEARLSHNPPRHHPAGDAVAAGREGVIFEALALVADVGRGRGGTEVVGVGVARFAKGRELLAAPLDLLVLRGRRVPGAPLGRASSLPLPGGVRLRGVRPWFRRRLPPDPRHRSCPYSLLEARFDEGVEVAVQHALSVARLDPGAKVLDPGLVKHVGTDLVAPPDVGLRVLDHLALRVPAAHLELVELRAELLGGRRAVLVLGAVVLALHHDPGRKVGDPNRGLGPVDVLAARPARPVHVDAKVGPG